MSAIINIKTGFRAVLATAMLAAALLVPSQALAQQSCANAGGDPTAAQYCSVSGENAEGNNGVKGANTSSNEPTAEPVVEEVPTTEEVAVESSSSSLPFTGLDVGVLAIVAVALTGAGLLLRRLTASGVTRS